MQLQRAFTLVELSIVLVIIGLVTGGIMVGGSIKRSAELQSVGTGLKKYEGALMTFTEQYGSLPGELTNATQYWGTDASGCPTNTNFRVRKETCNGDGDPSGWTAWEVFRAWQHLANAGFVDGLYAGVAGTGGSFHTIGGVNAPKGKMENTVFGLQNLGVSDTSNTTYFAGDYEAVILFGGQTTNAQALAGVLTPKEAFDIDKKFDDGSPALGNLRQSEGNTVCSTGSESAAVYNLRVNSKSCYFFDITGL